MNSLGRVRTRCAPVWMSAVVFQFRVDALSKQVIVLPPVKQAVNVKV